MPLFGKRIVALHLHDNTGIYDEDITDAEVYDKLIEVITEDAKKLISEGNNGQRCQAHNS